MSGNELLHEQSQSQATLIADLEQQLAEMRLRCEHLSEANSELNTAKCDAEMRQSELRETCERMAADLKDLDALRECKDELVACKQRLAKVEAELDEQRDLVDQLNEAKEFLAENNSKLLTNIIKIQLFVESMGLDHSDIDSVPKVRAYEEALEK